MIGKPGKPVVTGKPELTGQPVAVTKFIQLLCSFVAIVPNPLAIVFALFLSRLTVFPSPLFANAGIVTSVPTINIVAAKAANIPRVVVVAWFIYLVRNIPMLSIYVN